MRPTDALKELARQVRGDTLQVLDATPDDWLTWSPPGTTNHILWHAGHAVWLQDLMCVELLSGCSELPKAWAETFGQGSQPRAISQWPPQDEVRRLLQTQLDRMLQLLSDTPDERLSQRPDKPDRGRTVLGWIIHGLHDEAKHNGEMYLLWKLCRLRA